MKTSQKGEEQTSQKEPEISLGTETPECELSFRNFLMRCSQTFLDKSERHEELFQLISKMSHRSRRNNFVLEVLVATV